MRVQRHGDPMLDVAIRVRRSVEVGDRIKNNCGYWLLKIDPDDDLWQMTYTRAGGYKTGYVLEHRYRMARHLGRMLLPDEEVHHKNGDRADNRLENLELWVTSQPAGQAVLDKVNFAKEILRRYAPEHLA